MTFIYHNNNNNVQFPPDELIDITPRDGNKQFSGTTFIVVYKQLLPVRSLDMGPTGFFDVHVPKSSSPPPC